MQVISPGRRQSVFTRNMQSFKQPTDIRQCFYKPSVSLLILFMFVERIMYLAAKKKFTQAQEETSTADHSAVSVSHPPSTRGRTEDVDCYRL